MKLLYCTHSLYSPGGMERVLVNKVTYLTREKGWNICIITTDQKGRPPFYELPQGVRLLDLGINYSDDNDKATWQKIIGYFCRRRRHRKVLERVLMQEKADVVISLYPSESSFIPSIRDGSKKVLELHYSKFFRLQYGRTGILGLADRFRTWQDERIVRRFHRFVVLTHEDYGYWGKIAGMRIIPNAALCIGDWKSDVSTHRVIAVGRLDYQKGFDRLIQAWEIIRKDGRFNDWKLDIFGQGEWWEKLQQMIDEANLNDSVCLKGPTKQIAVEYASSSLLVMSSNYEGFPMVMIEAMAGGLPVVSFDCKCGPRDIINDGENGLLVSNGDIAGLAAAMMKVMGNQNYRKKLSSKAVEVTEIYSEESIMQKWVELFTELANN